MQIQLTLHFEWYCRRCYVPQNFHQMANACELTNWTHRCLVTYPPVVTWHNCDLSLNSINQFLFFKDQADNTVTQCWHIKLLIQQTLVTMLKNYLSLSLLAGNFFQHMIQQTLVTMLKNDLSLSLLAGSFFQHCPIVPSAVRMLKGQSIYHDGEG